MNGGACQISGTGYLCLCPNFYTGTNCQTCKHSKQINNKIKIIILNLNIDTNACTNNPCLNGAVCQVTGTGSTFTCICSLYYTGTYCQTSEYNEILRHSTD